MTPWISRSTSSDKLREAALAVVTPKLIAESTTPILVLGLDGRVLYANEAAAVLYERPLETLLKSSIERLVPRSERTALIDAARVALSGIPQRFELRVLTGSGEERIAAVAAAPFREEGHVVGSILTLRDITREQSDAEELAHSESRYRHLLEGASDAIMTFDALGRFTTINKAGEEISGYAREELLGRYFVPLLPLDQMARAVREFARAISGETGSFDTVILTKGGERREITVTYSCPRKTQEVLCVVRDISDERQLQHQLIQSEKMAAIGQLVSGVAHEINNPLASISAFAQLLLADRAFPTDHRHSAEIISTEARRAARIVHNLLTFARQHKSEKVSVNINQVLDDTLELRTYELNVRGIRIERDFDLDVPETMADVHQLQQVLLNIITNAEQAMMAFAQPHHRLTVRTRVDEALRIEIEDTGPGIPVDSLERIFNPFFTTKPVGQGTGLGLSISLGIMSEHGGRIWAVNLPGRGARFCIELPYVRNTPVIRKDPITEPARPAPGLRILVADDEAPIRLALERYFLLGGHRVVTTAGGSGALQLAGDEKFDAIILDIRMPDISGQEIFERWQRTRPDLASLVIFLTGDIVSTDLRRFLKSSGRPFLSKPFNFEDIAKALPQLAEMD